METFKQNGAVVLVPTGMHNTNVRRAHTNTDGRLLPSAYPFVVVVEHNVNVLAHTSRIYYYYILYVYIICSHGLCGVCVCVSE